MPCIDSMDPASFVPCLGEAEVILFELGKILSNKARVELRTVLNWRNQKNLFKRIFFSHLRQMKVKISLI